VRFGPERSPPYVWVHPDEGAGLLPADSFLDWVSLNQSYHPAPLSPVKGVHDVVPVEYGQETFRSK
jgi:hypothetical protein